MRARGWRDYSMIELRHLRYFIAAAECGSFRRAAKRFGVQESAVSRRTRDLEDEFGVAVFIRSHAGISPIRHGKPPRSKNRITSTIRRIAQVT
jgi:Bacterial regulatory helix-turn-helix protein, lysR family